MLQLFTSKRCDLVSPLGHSCYTHFCNDPYHQPHRLSPKVPLWAVGATLWGLLAFPAANMSIQPLTTLTASGNNDNFEANEPNTSGTPSNSAAKRANSPSALRSLRWAAKRPKTLFTTSPSRSGASESETISVISLSSSNGNDIDTVDLLSSGSETAYPTPPKKTYDPREDPMKTPQPERFELLKRYMEMFGDYAAPPNFGLPQPTHTAPVSTSPAQNMAKILGIPLKTVEWFISASTIGAPYRKRLMRRLQRLSQKSTVLPSLYSEMKAKPREFYCAAIATGVPSLAQRVKEALKQHWGWEPNTSAKQFAVECLYKYNWAARAIRGSDMRLLLRELIDPQKLKDANSAYGMEFYEILLRKLDELVAVRKQNGGYSFHIENVRVLQKLWAELLDLGINTRGFSRYIYSQNVPIKNRRF